MKKKLFPVLALCLGIPQLAPAQATPPPANPVNELRYNLTADGNRYVKAVILNQTWLRWNESNPGTLVYGEPAAHTFDVGLRRTRLQLFGQLTDNMFFYMQFGMNNFNYLTQVGGNRKLHAFFHDVYSEYNVFRHNHKLKIGAGLSIINGLSRFTQPSVGSIMTADVPVFLQATVEQTDMFARKLGVYARGQVGQLDYRFVASNPFPIETNGQTPPPIGPNATFSRYGHSYQYGSFLMYNFLEKEPHTTPGMAGTYLGTKRILNLEGGLIYQDRATWYLENEPEPVFNRMLLWSVAAFADMPLQDNKYALSAYAGYFNTDYGKGYIRNNGIMNPANGTATPATHFNGAGNAYPMFGTGTSVYTQLGLRLPNDLLGSQGTLLPYIAYRGSSYERLADPVHVYDTGINWLIRNHMSKLSLNYQLRPVFRNDTDGAITHDSYASTAWLQYQVAF